MILQEALISPMFLENEIGRKKMKKMLYHAYLPSYHEYHVSIQEILSNGLNHTLKSNNRYSNGGRVKLDLAEQLKPLNVPDWVDFKKAIGADMAIRFKKTFCFPEFTDKILVFNSEISLSIYDQAFYEDLKDTDEEALDFDTGRPLEYWIKLYWSSLMNLNEYREKRTYPKPEVLIFESVPREIIQLCEK